MRPRLVIAALSGMVLGLFGVSVYQGRQLRLAQVELDAAARPGPELDSGTNPRPSRLRPVQLPPIQIRPQAPLDWRSVESDDYPTYVANLRRIGCPESTIRDILIADIDKLYAQKRRALPQPTNEWQFWRHPDEGDGLGDSADSQKSRDAAIAALEQERRALITRILGPAADKSELEEFTADALENRNLRFLPTEKRHAVAEALAAYRQAEERLTQISDPREQREQLAAAERAFEENLAKNLTPTEREQYELRASPLAQELREKLRGFGASQEEFERLFRLQQDHQREVAALEAAAKSGSDPQAALKIEAAALELEKQTRDALGTRYSDFQRVADPDYQTLFGLTREHDVPLSAANDVWDMRREVERQTDRIRQDPLLTPDQRQRALAAIRTETQSAIIEVLGEPLLHEYQRQGGGWLYDLTEPETPRATTLETPVFPPLPDLPVTVTGPGRGPLVPPQ